MKRNKFKFENETNQTERGESFTLTNDDSFINQYDYNLEFEPLLASTEFDIDNSHLEYSNDGFNFYHSDEEKKSNPYFDFNILINPDGSINKNDIQTYLEKNGNNAIYDNQTLLAFIVNSDEIDIDNKMELIFYFISKGEKEGLLENKKLLAIAIDKKEISLANVLLQEGASVNECYCGMNLIDIALNTLDTEIILWVLKNASSLFLELHHDKFKEYFQKIITLTDSYENDVLKREILDTSVNYNKYNKEKIIQKFNKLGKIRKDETALVLAAKSCKKSSLNSIFVIDNHDIPILIKNIIFLLENNLSENFIKFQIIHFSQNDDIPHAVFGEFEIDKTTDRFIVRYLHCDPLPKKTPYHDVITVDSINEISAFANIEIYDSNVTIQKGLGCSYFSLDGAMMLATPCNRPYVENVMAHFKKHGVETILFGDKNVKYINSSSLPVRFLQGLQYIKTGYFLGGPSVHSIFNSENNNKIVNKKSNTVKVTIKNDLQENQDGSKTFNMRVNRKMQQYGIAVSDFLKDKDILSKEFSDIYNQHTIKGLEAFCKNKLSILKMSTSHSKN